VLFLLYYNVFVYIVNVYHSSTRSCNLLSICTGACVAAFDQVRQRFGRCLCPVGTVCGAYRGADLRIYFSRTGLGLGLTTALVLGLFPYSRYPTHFLLLFGTTSSQKISSTDLFCQLYCIVNGRTSSLFTFPSCPYFYNRTFTLISLYGVDALSYAHACSVMIAVLCLRV